MHGRKRAEYKAKTRDPAVARALAKKARQWHAVQAELLKYSSLPPGREREPPVVSDGTRDGGSNDEAAAAESSIVDEPTRQKLLVVTTQLLTVNPDPLWLWNRRRLLLLLPVDQDQDEHADSCSWKAAELELTETALQGNPKSYGAWLHRKWVWQRYLQEMMKKKKTRNDDLDELDTALQTELELVAQFLRRDERNFHGWNYRRFVVSCRLAVVQTGEDGDEAIVVDGSWNIPTTVVEETTTEAARTKMVCWMGAQIVDGSRDEKERAGEESTATTSAAAVVEETRRILESELEFSLTKIQDNFSNFSAFHYRSQLLPILQSLNNGSSSNAENDGGDDDSSWWEETLSQELELVESAIFTEPDDQTAWWYQRFLLDFASSQRQRQQSQQPPLLGEDERWQTHLGHLRELVQDEDNCKWAWLGLLQVMERLQKVGEAETEEEERREILNKLIAIDPDRKERYRHMLRKTTTTTTTTTTTAATSLPNRR